jgi:hypothetical protein
MAASTWRVALDLRRVLPNLVADVEERKDDRDAAHEIADRAEVPEIHARAFWHERSRPGPPRIPAGFVENPAP